MTRRLARAVFSVLVDPSLHLIAIAAVVYAIFAALPTDDPWPVRGLRPDESHATNRG